MLRYILWFACAILTLYIASKGYGQSNITWTIEPPLDGHIFPSASICMANTSAPFDFFAVQMANVPAGTDVKIDLNCPDLMDTSTNEFTTKKDNASLVADVKAHWKFDRLAQITQEIPTNVTYTVYINGQEAGERTVTYTVNSINDCLWKYRDEITGKLVLKLGMFAAYVNENDPAIEQVLQEALKSHIVNLFDGYQANNPGDVVRQVYAIWWALEHRRIKYSDISSPPNEPPDIFYQHVRFVDESINLTQANCVDGSVLFASILEHIGIDAGLVIKPHHMFLLFYASSGRKNPLCLETTMIGETNSVNPQIINPTKQYLTLLSRLSPSGQNFMAAVQYGDNEVAQLVQQAKQAQSKPTGPTGIIMIADARKFGILPIPRPGSSSGE
jgi:hypothetical protein